MANNLPYRKQPVRHITDDLTKPSVGAVVRNFAVEVDRVLRGLFAPPGGGGGGGGGGSSLSTRIQHTWCANGPYRVGTNVDGGWAVPTAMQITSVKLFRERPGTSGTTIIDLNVKPAGSDTFTSLYSTQSNRPTISYADTDLEIDCALPDTVALVPDDVVIPDTDQIEGGRPQNWALTIEGS